MLPPVRMILRLQVYILAYVIKAAPITSTAVWMKTAYMVAPERTISMAAMTKKVPTITVPTICMVAPAQINSMAVPVTTSFMEARIVIP